MDIIVACKRWGIAWAGVFLFWLAFIFAVGTVSICDAESWRPIDITLGAVFFSVCSCIQLFQLDLPGNQPKGRTRRLVGLLECDYPDS